MPVDWKALIDMVAPLGGALASGDGNSGHFMSGWQHGASVASQEKIAKQQAALERRNKGEQFKLDMVQKLMSVDDPFVFQQMKDAASHAGQAIHGMDPASWQGVQFPEGKSAAKQLKELNTLLDGMQKQGHNLDELAQSGSSIQLQSGETVPIASALDLTRRSPINAAGERIPAPKKEKTPAGTESERAAAIRQQIEVAMDAGDGKTADRLSAQYRNILEANREIGNASRKPGDPQIDELNTTLKQLQVDKLQNPAPKAEPRQRFNVQPITNPDGTTGLVRINMDTGETSRVDLPTGTGSGRPSDTQRLSKAYVDRSVAADKTAANFEKGLIALGPQMDVKLPSMLQSEAGQRYRQARDEFINAALRRESGAAIQPSEYERFDAIYFVQPRDKPATIRQKQEARARVVSGFRTTAGNITADAPASQSAPMRKEIPGHPGKFAVSVDGGATWKAE